jgi:hypothetical protein
MEPKCSSEMLVQSCANSSVFLTHFDAHNLLLPRFQQSPITGSLRILSPDSQKEALTIWWLCCLCLCVCVCGGGRKPFLLLCRHDVMIPRIIAQHWPPRNSLGRQSCVCQATWKLHFFILEHLTIFSICRHTDWYVGLLCCKDVTASFDVWSSNELKTALHSSARDGACCVQGQGYLNRGTITVSVCSYKHMATGSLPLYVIINSVNRIRRLITVFTNPATGQTR